MKNQKLAVMRTPEVYSKVVKL